MLLLLSCTLFFLCLTGSSPFFTVPRCKTSTIPVCHDQHLCFLVSSAGLRLGWALSLGLLFFSLWNGVCPFSGDFRRFPVDSQPDSASTVLLGIPVIPREPGCPFLPADPVYQHPISALAPLFVDWRSGIALILVLAACGSLSPG